MNMGIYNLTMTIMPWWFGSNMWNEVDGLASHFLFCLALADGFQIFRDNIFFLATPLSPARLVTFCLGKK
jgi:hypothetical protein